VLLEWRRRLNGSTAPGSAETHEPRTLQPAGS
jgi:hypothetical protein